MSTREVNAPKVWNQILEGALILGYILLMALNFLGELAGLPRALKGCGIVVVCIAALRFLVCFDTENARYKLDYFLLILTPVALVLSVSVLIWLSNLDTFSEMYAASDRLLVQAINIFVAIAAIYLFRGAAMRYTLYSMSLAYGYIVFRAVIRFGVSSFLNSVVIFATSLGIRATGAMAALEVHDMTFAFGFFVVYYFNAPKEEPRRLLCRVLSSVCFLLGYKRIAIFGVFLALAYGFYFSHVRRLERPRALMRLCFSLFLFSYAYLFFTRYGAFTYVMDKLGIDTMGRTRLYSFINPYFDISITFKGYGFNYVRSFMSKLRDAGLSEFTTAALHNEVVRQYIELGFWGYLIWAVYELLIRPRWMLDKHGLNSAKVYVLCTLYIFTTYLTDNTMYYYHTAFAYRLIPLVCAQMYHDEADARVASVVKGNAVQ